MEPFKLNKTEKGVCYLSIPEFEENGIAKTFFSTRVGGVSEDEFCSLNFGGLTKDIPERVEENRKIVLDACGIEDCTVAFLRQVHGNKIACIKSKDILDENVLTINDVDGVTTNIPNVLLVTLHADCLPLFFLDPVKKVVGVAHAGWRGTSMNISKNMVNKMHEEFESAPEDIIAAIGPGISLCCFETGFEVYEKFQGVFNQIDACSDKKENGKYMINLKKINEIQLLEAGVSKVLASSYCTKCREDIFFSHRRDNGKTGRMGAGIILTGR